MSLFLPSPRNCPVSIRRHCLNALYSTRSQEDGGTWPSSVTTSDKILEQRSTFLAHASVLRRESDLPAFFEHLESIPRLKRGIQKTTHRMYAYKVGNASGQNDGGESGAGQLLGRIVGSHKSHDDVVVVVWRWYGVINSFIRIFRMVRHHGKWRPKVHLPFFLKVRFTG